MAINIYPLKALDMKVDSTKVKSILREGNNLGLTTEIVSEPYKISGQPFTSGSSNVIKQITKKADYLFFNLLDQSNIENVEDLRQEIYDTNINKYVSVTNPASGPIAVKENHNLLLRFASEKHKTFPEFFAYDYDVTEEKNRSYEIRISVDYKENDVVFFEPGLIYTNSSIDIPITYYPPVKIYPELPVALNITFNFKYKEKGSDTLNDYNNNEYVGNFANNIGIAIIKSFGFSGSSESNSLIKSTTYFTVKTYSPVSLYKIGNDGKFSCQGIVNSNLIEWIGYLYDLDYTIDGRPMKLNLSKTISQAVFPSGYTVPEGSAANISTTIVLEESNTPTLIINVTCAKTKTENYLNSEYTVNISKNNSTYDTPPTITKEGTDGWRITLKREKGVYIYAYDLSISAIHTSGNVLSRKSWPENEITLKSNESQTAQCALDGTGANVSGQISTTFLPNFGNTQINNSTTEITISIDSYKTIDNNKEPLGVKVSISPTASYKFENENSATKKLIITLPSNDSTSPITYKVTLIQLNESGAETTNKQEIEYSHLGKTATTTTTTTTEAPDVEP